MTLHTVCSGIPSTKILLYIYVFLQDVVMERNGQATVTLRSAAILNLRENMLYDKSNAT